MLTKRASDCVQACARTSHVCQRGPKDRTEANLEGGMTIDEVLEQFPVTREQVKAVLEFAARSLDVPISGR